MNNNQPNTPSFLNSLNSKYILVVVVILATTMSTTAYLDFQSQRTQYINQLNLRGVMLGNFVALVSPDAILGYDFVLMDEYMREITHRQDVVYSIVLSPENLNITSYLDYSNHYIRNSKKENLLEIVTHLQNHPDIINLKFPIIENGEVYGNLLLGLSTERINNISKEAFQHSIMRNLLIIFILGVGIFWVFRLLVLRPIKDLVISSHYVANGDLDHKVSIKADDELGYLAKSFNDMTSSLKSSYAELNEKNHELSAATKAKSAFLANMSHEIRTPLTAILGFAESMMDSNASPVEIMTSINTIIRNGVHLQKIINDILDISKIEADKLDIELIDASPLEMLKDVEALVAMQATSKNLTFELNYQFPLPVSILTDPLRLKQILVNLAGNAIKFTDSGKITIEASCDFERELMKFTVTDTGIGLSGEQQVSVFDTFIQADTSTTRQYGGTGLGLPLSRRLSEMLGGSIYVCSTLGEGSQFCVTINTGPLGNADKIKTMPRTKQIVGCDQTTGNIENLGGNVLLAEDSVDNQNLIRLYIGKTKAKMTIVENGKLAIEALCRESFDLVLMDKYMPVMNGCDAVEYLRNKNNRTPIIALTADASIEDKEKYSCIGCDGFLAKPINRDALITALGKYLPRIDNELLDNKVKVVTHVESEKNKSVSSSVSNSARTKSPVLSGKILLAEDTLDNQLLIRMYVRKLGPSLTIVENGRLAVDTALRENFDLVLMDMQMPIMGGLQAISILKQNAYEKPIIAVSANALKHDRESYVQAGCADFIAKPIDRNKFTQVLLKYLPAIESKNKNIQSTGLAKGKGAKQVVKVPISESVNTNSDDFTSPNHFQISSDMEIEALKTTINMLTNLYKKLGESHHIKKSAEIDNKNQIAPITSEYLGEDVEFDIAISKFIQGLRDTQNRLNACLIQANWKALAEDAHKLKGAGGAFGLPQLTTIARLMETHLNSADYKNLAVTIEDLNWLCERIYSGMYVDTMESKLPPKIEPTIEPLYSELEVGDSEIATAVKKFLSGMTTNQNLVNQFHQRKSWQELQDLMHQIKGNGGAFGFPQLTDIAKEIIVLINNKEYTRLDDPISSLNTLCERISAGGIAA